MDQRLKKIMYCSVFEKLAANFANKKACTAIIGVNLAATHILLKGDHVFSALFLSKLPWKRFCVYFSCVRYLYVTFLTDVKPAQRKASRGLCFCLFVAKAWVSHVCGGHQLLSDRSQGQSLVQFSSSCHWCSLRHHRQGPIAGEDHFCCSTSRKQLEEEDGGTAYSRCGGRGHETGHSMGQNPGVLDPSGKTAPVLGDGGACCVDSAGADGGDPFDELTQSLAEKIKSPFPKESDFVGIVAGPP